MSKSIREIESAVEWRLKTYWVRGSEVHKDLMSFLDYCTDLLIEKIIEILNIHASIKINLVVNAKFTKDGIFAERNFKTKNAPVLRETDVNSLLYEFYAKLMKEISKYQAKELG